MVCWPVDLISGLSALLGCGWLSIDSLDSYRLKSGTFVWWRQVVALSPLSSVSSLDGEVMIVVVKSCLAWVACCYCCHHTLDLGGSSMQVCTCLSMGCCSFGSCSRNWLIHLKGTQSYQSVHHC